ncbi:hypothetical protein [Allokutzneria albata]|uniref:hypothetical protein n=1 Tax=Allokutzneria albata TaxID=211114 RepID=UPI0004C36923|nr:hypothetical protein [Allokutzneria albata]
MGDARGDRTPDRAAPTRAGTPLGIDGVVLATKELVDQEVRGIVEERYHEAVAILTEHRERLNALACTPLDREPSLRTPRPWRPTTTDPSGDDHFEEASAL